MEIERKFRLNSFPKMLEFFSKKRIKQGYIAIGNDGNEVRIRQYGDNHFLTIKGKGAVSREEFEIEITALHFKQLWPLTRARRLRKIRYTLNFEGYIIEIDLYLGNLRGLIIAEVEFNSLRECRNFVAPHWFGLEVTNDERYKNKNLHDLTVLDLL